MFQLPPKPNPEQRRLGKRLGCQISIRALKGTTKSSDVKKKKEKKKNQENQLYMLFIFVYLIMQAIFFTFEILPLKTHGILFDLI